MENEVAAAQKCKEWSYCYSTILRFLHTFGNNSMRKLLVEWASLHRGLCHVGRRRGEANQKAGM